MAPADRRVAQPGSGRRMPTRDRGSLRTEPVASGGPASFAVYTGSRESRLAIWAGTLAIPGKHRHALARKETRRGTRTDRQSPGPSAGIQAVCRGGHGDPGVHAQGDYLWVAV